MRGSEWERVCGVAFAHTQPPYASYASYRIARGPVCLPALVVAVVLSGGGLFHSTATLNLYSSYNIIYCYCELDIIVYLISSSAPHASFHISFIFPSTIHL